MTNPAASQSEDNGIAALSSKDLLVYSVGVSTGGVAEIRMAEANPDRHIVATTIDSRGVDFARKYVASHHLSDRIEIRNEDVSGPLAYPDGHFQFIYARLVLHYLTKQTLPPALKELRRILKPGGKIFIVVRSVNCPSAKKPDSVLDSRTGLTRYSIKGWESGRQEYRYRYFHTEESLSTYLREAGFTVERIETYDERLYMDFERKQISENLDNVIEVLAH